MRTKLFRSTVALAYPVVFTFVFLAAGCGTLEIEKESGLIPVASTASAATQEPASTSISMVSAPSVALQCPSNQRVELSVLVEPLDSGNVEIAGSEILTTGGATPVCRDDQMNITARPNDGYKFDHWELDVTGTKSTEVIVMTGSKKVRAMFVKIGEESSS